MKAQNVTLILHGLNATHLIHDILLELLTHAQLRASLGVAMGGEVITWTCYSVRNVCPERTITR